MMWLLFLQGKEAYTLSSADEREENIKIAAIDNGLAFPFKHPDEWRNCELRGGGIGWPLTFYTIANRQSCSIIKNNTVIHFVYTYMATT